MAEKNIRQMDKPFHIPVRRKPRTGHSLLSLQDDINHLFQDFFGEHPFRFWPEEEMFPSVDIVEGDKKIKVKAEIAGMDPENVEVTITDGYLTIKGERKEEKEEKDETYLMREMSYGSFHRTIALPEAANIEGAEAKFKNGMLLIEVPKKPEAAHKPKKLPIGKAA